ncbi:MAG: hypothetical protein ACXV5R_00305 [Candidatus Angelobacter sp.]
MATARNLYPENSSAPNIDVYSTPVVVYEGETFDWTISGQDGQASVTVEPIAGQSWPFSQSVFQVTRGNGTQATVNTSSAGTYQFQCNPAAPTSPQSLIVAKVFGQCGDPQAQRGQYFAWQNSQHAAIVIQASTGVAWPLVQSAPVVIPGNSTVIVQVSASAAVGDHGITVTMQQGGSGVCPQAGNPKIIITAPGVPK